VDEPVEESQPQKQPQAPGTAAEQAAPSPAHTVPATPAAPTASAAPTALAEGDLRASDADRDRVADILREALAEGRLDAGEHAERIERAYAAKTVGQLQPLVRDLPVGRAAAPTPAPAAPRTYTPDPSGENPNLVGILSGATRKGRWRVGHRINAVAIMGGVEIDLSEATFTAPELVIHCTAIMGGVSIRLPENVTLRGSGVIGIMGGSDIQSLEATDPDAPVVRIDGVAFCGGVEAKAKRGKKVKDWTKKRLAD
jgi:hypothetical protein